MFLAAGRDQLVDRSTLLWTSDKRLRKAPAFSDYILLSSRVTLARAIPDLGSRAVAGLDCAGRQAFAVDFANVLIAICWRAGGSSERNLAGAGHGSFGYGVRIGYNLLWLRLLELHALEIRRRYLERVEQETGGFLFESLLQDHLHDLANDGLNGVRVFKERQRDFAGCVISVEIALDRHGTILLMVETEILAAESGRTALDSADLDVLATSCCERRHRCSFTYSCDILDRC
jgi:hypothetical protein